MGVMVVVLSTVEVRLGSIPMDLSTAKKLISILQFLSLVSRI